MIFSGYGQLKFWRSIGLALALAANFSAEAKPKAKFCPLLVMPMAEHRVVDDLVPGSEEIEFQVRRASETPEYDFDRLAWDADFMPKLSLGVAITREPGLVIYEFSMAGKTRTVKIPIPKEFEFDMLPRRESFQIPEDKDIRTIEGQRVDASGVASAWRPDPLVQVAISRLYAATGKNADQRLDPIIEHLRYEQERYLLMLLRKETTKLDFRLLLPIQRDPFAGFFVENEKFAAGLSIFDSAYGVYIRQEKGFEFDPIRLLTDASRFGYLYQLIFPQPIFGMHIDRADGGSSVIEVVNGAKLKGNSIYRNSLEERLPQAIWQFVRDVYLKQLGPIYQQAGNLDLLKKRINEALRISQAVIPRSFLFTWMGSENSFVKSRFSRDDLNSTTHEMPPLKSAYRTVENIAKSIKGALTAVVSKSSNEPLPVELLFNLCLPRDGQRFLEVGRLAQGEEGRVESVSPKLIKMLVGWAGGASDIDKVIVHADDPVHVRMYERMGFREVDMGSVKACAEIQGLRSQLGLGDVGDLKASGGKILAIDVGALMRQQKLSN